MKSPMGTLNLIMFLKEHVQIGGMGPQFTNLNLNDPQKLPKLALRLV